MSRVTSLRACSSLSLDAARMDLLTVSRASSEAVPRTSMEPQTLSISSDLFWTPAMEKDFCMVSRSEEHTSELQSLAYLVCRLLLEKKKKKKKNNQSDNINDSYRMLHLFSNY